ncbi:MAG: hypothetical protein RBG1_1C00001G0252 [candidate division Zixibacteria bacterium RBG-1]|nr:MAG: hypothetical protein RBG1_1C00001G0252 [candidate division Zixibacteria bacterium RBG-1]OGC85462.1 MAG: hypothetical protein A2V73_06155 [candidate division Zixibacteria bacterium RBG_19FT_COMBO_42_43]
MWLFNQTLLEIALRSAIIYLVVLVGIRLSGKREVGQMTPFDLVLLLLIANAVQNAMTGPDTSVTGGLVAAGTLLTLNLLISNVVYRYKKTRHLLEGTPTLLIHSGKIIKKNLAKEKITTEALYQALREHGLEKIEEVKLAILEIDGTISVLTHQEMPQVAKPHHKIRFLHRK